MVIATDAAAKAGGRAFSEYQTVSAAKSAARVTARKNKVNGDGLKIRGNNSANEIEFGTTTQADDESRYVFNKVPTSSVSNGSIVASALRVNGLRNSNGLSGQVPLIIPGLLAQDNFSTTHSSIAMQVDRDISLVLDRSSSMLTITWDWPSGHSPWYTSTKDAGVAAGLLYKHRGNYYYESGVSSTEYKSWVWEDHYGLGPAPVSPWEYLLMSVDAFIAVLDDTPQEEQVSIASYSSTGRLDSWLEKDLSSVSSTVHSMYPYGNTAIGDGMDEAIQALVAAEARPYAAKTMVVMTDGHNNRGTDPNTVAGNLIANNEMTIHTVTFGAGSDQSKMRDVADTGGGKHFHANTGGELVAIFEEIANNLPTILTQ